MTIKKAINVFLRFIDGTETFVPVKAEEINDNVYQILRFEEYNSEERSVLYEFKPGDIVNIKKQEFNDGTIGYLADQYSNNKSEKEIDINQFLFRILTGKLDVNSSSKIEYKDYIQKIHNELENGIHHYPAIKKWIDLVRKR
jgi:transcription antitermination factor NusG